MKGLSDDKDFLCINQNVNIFDIISCKEEQASQIIAWLLNPREAHGFGNRFFGAMLDAASSNSQISGYKYSEGKAITARKQKQKLLNEYNDVIVQTEYCIEKRCKDKEGRVDILLCLGDAKTMFVIENKYGSQEHGTQTKKYFKHFTKKYHDYTVFFIYLDVKKYFETNKFEISDSKDHWYFLGYEWMIDFLKKNDANDYVRKIIKDVIVEFDDDNTYEEYFEPFYSKAKTLFSDYKDDLSNYNDYKKSLSKYKGLIYPYLPPESEESVKQFAIYDGFYATLAQYSQWDTLIEKLEENGYVADTHGDKYVCITLKNVRDKYCELNKNKKTKKLWPFYVKLKLFKVEAEETEMQNLEVKILCTNEYVTTTNITKITNGLDELFGDKEAECQKYVTQNIRNIKPYKSGENISFFYLYKEIIENFDFSSTKMEELCEKLGKSDEVCETSDSYASYLNEMYDIFFGA